MQCPPVARLKALLEGTLPAVDQEELSGHLGDCRDCQLTVESLAAGHETWQKAAGNLAVQPAGTDRALQDAIDEAKLNGPADEAEPAVGAAVELPAGFLAPSDDPAHLGKLGHYDVVETIGRGAFGIVLRAFDRKLHRVVAIKVMSPVLATTAGARKRFVREARAAAAVCHEHVVTIHTVDEAHGLPYLVMQFVGGRSLQERIDETGPLDVREILRIGMQVAAGLAAAHAQGLVHRDIKPANILLENGVERVQITDFGLARTADDASLTQTAVIAGTPQYMAPEQARGDAVDQRADLFSLGSVLSAMCTGRAPFRARSMLAVLRRVCEDAPRPVRQINPEVPEWLAAIIEKLHAKSPSDRFQSATEVHGLLAECLAHLQQPEQCRLPARVFHLAAPSASPETSPSGVALSEKQTGLKRNDAERQALPLPQPAGDPTIHQDRTTRRIVHLARYGLWGVVGVCIGIVIFFHKLGPWMGEVFEGTLTGLTPATRDAVYGVVWAGFLGYIVLISLICFAQRAWFGRWEQTLLGARQRWAIAAGALIVFGIGWWAGLRIHASAPPRYVAVVPALSPGFPSGMTNSGTSSSGGSPAASASMSSGPAAGGAATPGMAGDPSLAETQPLETLLIGRWLVMTHEKNGIGFPENWRAQAIEFRQDETHSPAQTVTWKIPGEGITTRRYVLRLPPPRDSAGTPSAMGAPPMMGTAAGQGGMGSMQGVLREIDLVDEEDQVREVGILYFDGALLRLCLAPVERGRPTRFETRAKSDWTSFLCQREPSLLRRLQGRWRVVALARGGEIVPEEERDASWEIFEDRILLSRSGERRRFVANEETHAWQLVDADGTVMRTGVFSLEGNEFRVCWGPPDDPPKELAAKAGTDHELFVLTR